MDNVASIFKWAVIACALALIVWGVTQINTCTAPVQTQGPGLPVVIKPPVSENNPSVPAPKKKQGGTLVIIRQPKPLADGSHPNTRPDTITVQIPVSPRETPPHVFGSDTSLVIEWTPVRDPWAEILPTYHFGASVDPDGRLSPWFGFGIVRAFGISYAGCSVDASGGGIFVGFTPLQSLSLDCSYRILRINSDRSTWSLSLAYTL
jgi:hypothetical protein